MISDHVPQSDDQSDAEKIVPVGLVAPLDTHKAAISHPHEALEVPEDVLPHGHANGTGLLDMNLPDLPA